MRSRFTGLWQHTDFLKLWSAETISLFGSQITLLAIPLTAESILKATSVDMGVLSAAQFLPFLLFGLFAGVWVDRMRRRPILIFGDIGRFVLLLTIPLAAFLHVLALPQLIVVSFLVGILTLFFDVAYQSYLPSLISRENLVEGNSKLEVSRAIAQIAGPGIAGALIKLISAPLTISLDALSFLVSGLFLWRIKTQEPEPAPRTAGRHMLHEVREGLGVIFGNPMLRAIAGCTSTSNLFGMIQFAVIILFFRRELGIDELTIGGLFALGSVGGLIGALVSDPIVKRFGLGRTIVASAFTFGIATVLIPMATGANSLSLILLTLAQILTSFASVVYNINQVSLRQTITPDRLQGRMNASMRFMIWGTMPIGSLIGGFLGQPQVLGLRGALIVGALGSTLSFLWILFSPLRSLKTQPEPIENGESAEQITASA